MYKYERKRELIKNAVFIFFILLIAVVSTYFIYYKFQDVRNVDFNSESLVVTYHEVSGDRILIKKITPVTDSVGLSSKSYSLSIKNNLTEKVRYRLKIVDDEEKIEEDDCEDILIPKEDIRISVKVNKSDNTIYNLSDLEEGILLDDEIKALDMNSISIRVWIRQDSELPRGSKMHYHGIIQVVEEDDSIAINQ